MFAVQKKHLWGDADDQRPLIVPVFEKIFPRPRLPHEIASHVVRFCFHTGDY